ncbi:MAG: DNA polymerase III subunit alpha [Lentisphaeria bacterium]|nr:DNA polymerase III subunit alpha [Lentisphaeria bacterium]
MPSDFVHLHLHTHYSMLDGACTAPKLVKLAQKYEMPAVAITDHGYMGGVEEFHRLMTAAEINPVIGCEAYIAPGSRFDHNPAVPFIKGFHLVLLCENETGYHNLCKLISEAYRTGIYYKPRMDKELLAKYHEGLIALSACIAGEIPRMLLGGSNDDEADYHEPEPASKEDMLISFDPGDQIVRPQSAFLGNFERAEKSLKEYLDIFGRENFFIELMDHGMEQERQANVLLVELARKYDLKLVATNDVHYMEKGDAAAHEVMLCIQTGSKLSDPKRFRFPSPEFYFKSEAEMRELFKELPEAITNTRLVAERCSMEFHYVPKVNHYPVYRLPDGTVPGKDYLRKICLDNMQMRYGFDGHAESFTPEQQKVIDRMDYELGIIERTGFCSYFLVVSDFIAHAKQQGVPVGPGRGSGAGSVVAYLTLITDIDPLEYDLLFERFLNPERVSPPDFDVDFCEKRRGEVIDYVRDKYGHESVAQISTYGQLKAKAVVKDVARVLGKDFEFGNRLTKMIPDDPKMTLAKAEAENKELAELLKRDPEVRQVWEYATVLEGLNRQPGIHAAGVIIGDQPLDNLVPLARSAQGGMVVEFTAVPCEQQGLLKMDFLGLRTLTIIRNAQDLIKENQGIDIELHDIPLDDEKTFEMLRRGDTIAVFQLESAGMRNLCRNFGVETVKHLIALVAIYRPGPMQFIPTFIARKKGEEKIIYDHPKMERYLKETYGIMLYQEQIMQVVQVLAGFSLGGADILRRAIGKKKVDVMAKQKEKFIAGCAEHSGISAELAETIWGKIELFAGYGFNKSHSAAYGVVSYYTAYLKANYPVEFMAAVLTSELENADKIAFLISACREMGISILPPDVNSSGISFSVDGPNIRFGLGAIKGMGEGAAGKIIESRKKDGKFKSFLDFCERCGSEVNSRMVEHLTRAGALDSLGLRRSQILAVADKMMAYAAERARDKAAGQGSLFDMLGDGGDGADDGFSIPVPDLPEFAWEDILKSEKELLGFYVSGHPLDSWTTLLWSCSTLPIRLLDKAADGDTVRLTGMVDSVEFKFSKNSGKQFGVLHLEDLDAHCECMLYERALGAMAKEGITLEQGMPVAVEVTVSKREESESPRLAVERVLPLAEAPQTLTQELYLHLPPDASKEKLEAVAALLRRFPGESDVIIALMRPDDSVVYIESRMTVVVTMEFLQEVDSLLGKGHYKLKVAPCAPSRRRWEPKETQIVTD